MPSVKPYLIVPILLIVFLGPVKPAFAQENSEDLFNYSFAIWLGSGIYRISDAHTRFAVLRLPLSYSLKEVQMDGQDMGPMPFPCWRPDSTSTGPQKSLS